MVGMLNNQEVHQLLLELLLLVVVEGLGEILALEEELDQVVQVVVADLKILQHHIQAHNQDNLNQQELQIMETQEDLEQFQLAAAVVVPVLLEVMDLQVRVEMEDNILNLPDL
jgi:hypothetical protein